MNEVQRAALELRVEDVRSLAAAGHDLAGCLLAACSAHDPDARKQSTLIRFLVRSGVSVHETDTNHHQHRSAVDGWQNPSGGRNRTDAASSGADYQAKNKSGKKPADYVTDPAMQAVFRTYDS